MDSRLAPLDMVGLKPGDAKIFRNPGGRVTEQALEALVLGAHLLNVERILIVPHTRCAMTGQHPAGAAATRSASPRAWTPTGSSSAWSRTSWPRSRRTCSGCVPTR